MYETATQASSLHSANGEWVSSYEIVGASKERAGEFVAGLGFGGIAPAAW